MLPPPSRAWRRCLLDPGSLTEHLVASGDRFRVALLGQHWQRPSMDDARALQRPRHQQVLVREVLLCVDDVPWVYGRTVIPIASFSGPLRHLRHLDNRSLGTQLFRYPGLRRDPFQLARIIPHYHLPEAARQHCPDQAWLWGRRSRFILGERSLLVSEVFLPAFQMSAKHQDT